MKKVEDMSLFELIKSLRSKEEHGIIDNKLMMANLIAAIAVELHRQNKILRNIEEHLRK